MEARMQVAVPRETHPGERRVALVPEAVSRLGSAGLTFLVEAGAGLEAGFTDSAYAEAGAQLGTAGQDVHGADVVVRVRAPDPAQIEGLREGALLIGFLQPLTSPDLLRDLAASGVTAVSMELVPRITRAQRMDALSSQATIAGYKAALLAASASPRLFPMLMTAAGTIAPAKVLVIGAGVAGLQAIATARRLGAVVQGFDIRPAVKDQVESLGATWVGIEMAEAEGAGGYAKEVSEEAQRREHEHLHKLVSESDVVITTAQIPGRPAPRLITADMVADMRSGSVIVDLASESGGNCELTRMDEEVQANGVLVLGPANLPATAPLHASQMYSRNVAALLQHFVKDGQLNLDFEDEITRESVVTHGGQIVHERVRALAGAAT
jgi:NAD(P) transhydrogenase subunit alpha